MSMSSDGDVAAALPPAERRFGPWLWLMVLQFATWRPLATAFGIADHLHHRGFHGFADLPVPEINYVALRAAPTLLLFLAVLIMTVHRRWMAIQLMIAALWLVIPFYWLREWLVWNFDLLTTPASIRFFVIGAIGLIFVPVAWTGYLLEAPQVAALFPGRKKRAAQTGRTYSSSPRSASEFLASLPAFGPWLGLSVFCLVFWDTVRLVDVWLRHHALWDFLYPSTLSPAAHRWLYTAVPSQALEILAGLFLLLYRHRMSVFLTVNALWFSALLGLGVELGFGWMRMTGTNIGLKLFDDASGLIWPIAWAAYLLESARITRLYPRTAAARLTGSEADVF